jgi:hypothetical protein
MNEKYRKKVIEAEKEKLKILDPVVRKYHLTLDELGALSTIEIKMLRKVVEKLCVVEKEAPKPKDVILDKVFMKKTADLLYYVAKCAVPDKTKVISNKIYRFNLPGFQVFNLFNKSGTLYDKCREEEEKPKEDIPVEGTAQPT